MSRRVQKHRADGQPRIAYTAVVTEGGSAIGIAEENVTGYTPVERYGVHVRHDAAQRIAAELNDHLGLTVKEAWQIVASSMPALNKRLARGRGLR